MQLTLRTKALIGVAVAVTGFVIFGPSGTDTVAPATDHAAARPAARQPAGVSAHQAVGRTLFDLGNRVADAASAATLFAVHSWYVAPPPPPPPPPSSPVVEAPVVPTAPPLPFAYMGSYFADGGAPVYFVTMNDRIFDLKVGDVVEGNYSFDGLRGNLLIFTYKPLNVQQTLATSIE
jgi:hypothetical protein